METWLHFVVTLVTGGGIIGILNWFLSKRKSDHEIFVDNFTKIIEQKDRAIAETDARKDKAIAEADARWLEREKRLAEELATIRERYAKDVQRADKLTSMIPVLKEQLADLQIENAKLREGIIDGAVPRADN